MSLGAPLGILLGAADGALVADTPIIVPAASKIIIHRTKSPLMFAFFVFYENARSSSCGGHVTLTLPISDVYGSRMMGLTL